MQRLPVYGRYISRAWPDICIRIYIDNFGIGWYHFAEYMIYSEMWSMRNLGADKYEIFIKHEEEVLITKSLQEFLERFVQGNVFDEGGLDDWRESKK